jgi:hypothetical protein
MISTGGLSNYEQCREEAPQEDPEAQVQKAEENDETQEQVRPFLTKKKEGSFFEAAFFLLSESEL